MDNSRPCHSCRKRTLAKDGESGKISCMSCGAVEEFDDFQEHFGGFTGPTGTNVRVGTAGTGSVNNYKENKIFKAQKLIDDFMCRFELSVSKSREVRILIEKITDGEYGQGNWFPVLIGACTYVVMRNAQKVMPIVKIADSVGCDVYQLGRMIGRVVDFLDMKLPEFDIVNSFEHAVENCSSFSQVSKDTIGKMLKQGVFLVQCLIKWFVTTGRKPMPVVAAVLVFVAELNQLSVKLEDIANELHVALSTCRMRYKELLERLVEVARVLPWGKDVTVKNVLKNAPYIIQYMEMKSMAKSGDKNPSFEFSQCDIQELVEDCLRTDTGSYSAEESRLNYFDINRPSNSSGVSLDNFRISPECLTMIYSNFKDEISLVKANAEMIGVEKNIGKRRKHIDLHSCIDWWSGKSDLSKKLFLKEVLKKDVGLDVTPPSFDKACLAYEKRRERIKTAKSRIQRIMNPEVSCSGKGDDPSLVVSAKSGEKRKRVKAVVDWEDFIIETLLLHNVNEEDIEKGHYKVLLDLHVFNYCSTE